MADVSESVLPDVLVEHVGQVTTVTLNRPAKRNALDNAMYGDIARALETAAADPAVHVAVLKAAGNDFCAGNDIGMFLDASEHGNDVADSNVERFLTALSTFPKPLLAAVPGQAIGVGVTMLLHCDVVFVDEDARLRLPFINLGLVPEAAASRLLPAIVGHPKAFAMFAFGEAISGREAVAIGLANEALQMQALEGRVMEAALALAGKSPAALAATKRLMRDATMIAAALAADRAAMLERLASPEAVAALEAFRSRRSDR